MLLSGSLDEPDELLAGLPEPQGLPRPVVELLGDRVQIALRARRQIRALREVLAQEPVGVLVGSPPPGGVRVAEAHVHAQRRGYRLVQRELAALVPGERVAHELGQPAHLPYYGILNLLGGVPVGQVQQDGEAGRALHERAYGAPVGGAGYEVALPVAGHRPVLRLGRALGDHDHGVAEARAARGCEVTYNFLRTLTAA